MMHCPDKILQWNVNGLKTRLPRIQALINDMQPKILALQEIKLNDNFPIYFRGYTIYKKLRPVAGGGGVCLAVHTQLPSTPIQLNTALEAVACKVHFKGLNLNICNVYFNEPAEINYISLRNLIDSIPNPKLILGDMNAKHVAWGSPETNDRGTLINNVFSDKDLFVLNDGSPTYYNSFLDLYSHIDITACSDTISHKFDWEVYHSKMSSDHFPIFVTYDLPGLYTSKPAKWKFDNANWANFKQQVSLPTIIFDINAAHQQIVESILNVCSDNIPKTSTSFSPKYNCFWWNDDCAEALRKVRRQERLVHRNHSPANVQEYRRLDALATRTLLEAKSNNWKEFLSTVNSETSNTLVWKVIKCLSGKFNSKEKIVLSLDNGAVITDPEEIANHLGRFFSNISSDNNYSEEFLLHKIETEFSQVHFLPSNGEKYNNIFTLNELETALNSCLDTSPGEDGIHYLMIKKLPHDQLLNLLQFFNHLWVTDSFPDSWRSAIVLPFLKPNKPKHCMSSYRPISLTSCLCKIFEKMVLFRLTRYLEKNKIIQPFQSGFKKLHSTIDPLVRLESAIQETFLEDNYLVAVFIDLEKAYDMVWRRLVLQILSDIGLKGHLPTFIKNFLMDRVIKVKVGEFLSQAFLLENGLPQGSVLSCILFSLIINTIFNDAHEIAKSLFCDDGLFWATGKTLDIAVQKIQRALEQIEEWCNLNGPKISSTKTHYNIFTKKNINYDPIIMFNGVPLQRKETVKYLGVTFDTKLTWNAHISDVVGRCQQPLNMMRKVARHDWGGDRASLKMMYIGLIRSIIDYACFLYSNAADGHLQKIDRIQYQAIRIITGNMKGTICDNLEAEVHLMPLRFRRQLLALRYFSKISRMPRHPVKILYDNFYNFQFYSLRPWDLPVIGRAKLLAENLNVPISTMESFENEELYTIKKINVFYNLLKDKNSYTSMQFQQDYNHLVNTKYHDTVQIFTDGSKIDRRCGCAFYVDTTPPIIVSKRLPSNCSVFNAEVYAIYRALLYARDSEFHDFVIFSDSLSALQFLENPKMDHRVKLNIHKLLNNCNKNIAFEWCPGHSNILGNEIADTAAKESLNNQRIVKLRLHYDDCKSLISKLIFNQWQLKWTSYNGRLKTFKPILGDWKSAYRKSRKEEKILSRLRTDSCFFYSPKLYRS